MATKRKRPNNPSSSGISAGRLWVARILIGLALGVSAYLAYVSLTEGTVAGCGGDSGCGTVLKSRWAKWFGLPVSLFAAGVDISILAASFRLGPGVGPALQRRAWSWLVPLSMLVAGAAVWFVALQLVVVRAICPYCMVAHLSGLGGAGLLLWAGVRFGGNASGKERPDLLPPAQFKRAWALAAVGLATLAIGQIAQPAPKTFAVTPMAKFTNDLRAPASAAASTSGAANVVRTGDASVSTKTAPPQPSVSAGTPVSNTLPPVAANGPVMTGPGAQRLFPVYGGRFQLNLNEVPLLGSWTNQHVIVTLLDYTCHHCRAMHPLLVDLQRTFSNELAIVCLPMPLDPGCNWTVTRHYGQHTNACEYARLGLSVWRADPSKYRAYEDWVMEGEERAPALELAQQKALELVGQNALQKAVQDPWIDRLLRQSVGIYDVAYKQRQGQMPQMIVGPNVAVGTYPRAELFKLVETTFGLRVPP